MHRRNLVILIATFIAVIAVAVLLWKPRVPVAPVGDGGEVPIAPTATSKAPPGKEPELEAPVRTRSEFKERRRRSFVVQVTSADGAVAGAKVLAVCALDQTHGTTDGSGSVTLAFENPARAECVVQAWADGFAPAISWERSPWGRRIKMYLADAAVALEGVVRLDNGAIPPARLEVVAWPEKTVDPAPLLAQGGGVRTLVDAQGAFRLHGVQEGRSYRVGVAGQGWTCKKVYTVVPSVRNPPDPLKITACKLYGVLARAQDERGAQPPPSDLAYMAHKAKHKDLMSLGQRSVDWALAGLWRDWQRFNQRKHWAQWLFAFKGWHPGHVGAFRVRYFVPGYSPAYAEVEIFPITKTLPVRVVTLTRTGEPLVDVAVRFEPNLGRSGVQLRGAPLFELRLKNLAEDTRHKWRKYYKELADGTLQGLSAGVYEVELARWGGAKPWHPREGRKVTFGPGEENRITFDLSATAALRLEGPDENWEREPRKVSLGGKNYNFEVGPYLLWGLSAGRFNLQVSGADPMTVELVAGETTTVKVERR